MALSYVVTAQKPTAVTHSLTCNFTSSTDVNLILARSTRLEIRLITPEGLVGLHDVPLYGKIASIGVLEAQGVGGGGVSRQSSIAFLTEKYQLSILGYNSERKEIITKVQLNVRDRIGKPVESCKLCLIDPQSRLIALHLYCGTLKIIPMDARGQLREGFNLRTDEFTVVNMCLLHGCAKPTIAVLYQDATRARHLKTYTINVREKELIPGPWEQKDAEDGAEMLVPVPAPYLGVLIVGRQTITYYNGGSSSSGGSGGGGGGGGSSPVFKAISMQPMQMSAVGAVGKDGKRFLFGNHFGGLYVVVLSLDKSGTRVSTLHMDRIGDISSPSCITYLDSGVIFVGSCYGDSCLVKLNSEKDETGSNVELLQSFPNIGPILHMCMVDLQRQGQGQGDLVTCSGTSKDGSLRIIRNGIGINEQASIDLPGIKGMWPLRPSTACENDKYLVQAFISETRVLGIEGDEMEEVNIPGFLPGRTVLCQNLLGDMVAHVTEGGVVVLSAASLESLSKWTPPPGKGVTVAAANEQHVVVALAGGHLLHLEVDVPNKCLVERASVRLEEEIACLSVNSTANVRCASTSTTTTSASLAMDVDENGGSSSRGGGGAGGGGDAHASQLDDLVAVGMWNDMTVRLLELPNLTELVRQTLGGDMNARSVAMATFEGGGHGHTFLIGLGDGHLISMSMAIGKRIDQGGVPELGAPKKVALGTQPLSLTSFINNSALCVLASCDRPTVVYSSEGKLLFANVNIGDVNCACPFNSEPFPDCLALADEGRLTIGTIDEIQKLHITTVSLGEQPRRICHHERGRLFALLTTRWGHGGEEGGVKRGEEIDDDDDDYDDEMEYNFVRFLDDTSFEEIYNYPLEALEIGVSMQVCMLSDTNKDKSNDGNVKVKQEEEYGSGSGYGNVKVKLDEDGSGYGAGGASSSSTATVAEAGNRSRSESHQPIVEHIVVGTTLLIEDEYEPRAGRILVFGVTGEGPDRRVNLLVEKAIEGAPHCMCPFGSKLLVGVNNMVHLYGWEVRDDGMEQLVLEGAHISHVLVLSMAARGDFIIIGDLMRSVSLLMYKPQQRNVLEEVARDLNCNWTAAVEMLDDDNYIVAENDCNLFVVKRNADATTEEERARLELQGEFHLGEYVNTYIRGSLVVQPHETNLPIDRSIMLSSSSSSNYGTAAAGGQVIDVEEMTSSCHTSTSLPSSSSSLSLSSAALTTGKPLLFGTISGMVGVILTLTAENFTVLNAVQTAMRKVVKGIGGLSHAEWRSFFSTRRQAESMNMLDGDLIETFLDLSRDRQEEVVKHIRAAAEAQLGGGKDIKPAAAPAPVSGGVTNSSSCGGGGGGGSSSGTGTSKKDRFTAAAAAMMKMTLEDLTRRVEEMARMH